ncbi:MAG: hypothetical protein Q8M21_15580, partial [Methylococcaceae bacterium]|nr:hypothetical protein [Methylococcaceae bacterium]
QVAVVIAQVGDDAGQGGLTQASCPVVRQTVGRAGFVGGGQLVVEVVGISPDPVAAQVAVGVAIDATNGSILSAHVIALPLPNQFNLTPLIPLIAASAHLTGLKIKTKAHIFEYCLIYNQLQQHGKYLHTGNHFQQENRILIY